MYQFALSLAVWGPKHQAFLQEQVEAARHRAFVLDREAVARALRLAIRDVLRGVATPAEAAAVAVVPIQQSESVR